MAAVMKSLAFQAPVCSLSSTSSGIARPSQSAKFGCNVTLGAPLRLNRSCSPRATATTVDIDRLVADVKNLTLEQARTLTDRLQEELGVSAASFAPAVGVAAAGAPAEAAPVVEAQTEFDLVLEEVPTSARIAVIKIVRSLTSLGLKEAKDLIEGLPKTLKEATTKEDAEEGVKALEAVGAKCSIK